MKETNAESHIDRRFDEHLFISSQYRFNRYHPGKREEKQKAISKNFHLRSPFDIQPGNSVLSSPGFARASSRFNSVRLPVYGYILRVAALTIGYKLHREMRRMQTAASYFARDEDHANLKRINPSRLQLHRGTNAFGWRRLDRRLVTKDCIADPWSYVKSFSLA